MTPRSNSTLLSPRSAGQLAGALAMGFSESTHDNLFGHPRSGFPDSRCVGIDVQPGISGLHRGRTGTSPSPGTKFSQLAAFKALDVSYVDMGLDVLQKRRNSPPPPAARDCRNEILQSLDAFESMGVIGRRAPSPRAHSPRQEGMSRCRSPSITTPRRSSRIVVSGEEGYQAEWQTMEDRHGKSGMAAIDAKLAGLGVPAVEKDIRKLKAGKKVDGEKTMKKSLRRLDSCAAKLEQVAKALVQEAQRQSLKRVA